MPRGDVTHHGEKFLLAPVATVRGILGKARDLEFVRFNYLMRDTDRGGNGPRIVLLAGWIGGRAGRHGKRPVAEHVIRHLREKRTVKAS